MITEGIALSFEVIKFCLLDKNTPDGEREAWSLDNCYRIVERAHRSRCFNNEVGMVMEILSMICKIRVSIFEAEETRDAISIKCCSRIRTYNDLNPPNLCEIKMWHLNFGVNALMPLAPLDMDRYQFITLERIRRETAIKLVLPLSAEGSSHLADQYISTDDDSSSLTSDEEDVREIKVVEVPLANRSRPEMRVTENVQRWPPKHNDIGMFKDECSEDVQRWMPSGILKRNVDPIVSETVSIHESDDELGDEPVVYGPWPKPQTDPGCCVCCQTWVGVDIYPLIPLADLQFMMSMVMIDSSPAERWVIP